MFLPNNAYTMRPHGVFYPKKHNRCAGMTVHKQKRFSFNLFRSVVYVIVVCARQVMAFAVELGQGFCLTFFFEDGEFFSRF